MSKGKFTTKDFLAQLRMCPQLAYEFTNEEVFEAAKKFLEYVGYQLAGQDKLANVKEKLAFRAKRKDSKTKVVHEIIGVVRHDMTEVDDGIASLDILKGMFGNHIDYSIMVPPINERYLIDYMCKDDYKSLKKIQKEHYMIWLCNPEEKSVWSAFGAPRDQLFNEYFKHIGGIEMLFNMPFRGEAQAIQREVLDE